MKTIHSNAKKLFSTSTMLLALATLMFAGTEQAFANPGPAHNGNAPTGQIVQGGQGQMRIQSTSFANTVGGEIAVYSNENVILQPSGSCPLPNPLPTFLKYQLRDNDGVLVGYKLVNAGDFVQVPWGHGIFIQPINVQTSAGGTFMKGITATPAAFPLHWEEFNDGNLATADDTSIVPTLPDFYRLASCGSEGPTGLLKFQDSGAFAIVLPVGGTILSVDSSALIIAGLFTAPIMMIPVVGAAAGTAFAIYRLKK